VTLFYFCFSLSLSFFLSLFLTYPFVYSLTELRILPSLSQTKERKPISGFFVYSRFGTLKTKFLVFFFSLLPSSLSSGFSLQKPGGLADSLFVAWTV